MKGPGSAPMFFLYVLHLYVLLLAYQIILAIIGPNQGQLFGVDHLWWIRSIAALLTVLLYFPTRTFARFKHSTNLRWVEYF